MIVCLNFFLKKKISTLLSSKRRMSDDLSQNFEKISFKPLSNSSPIFSSFLVHFEWLKTCLGCQLRLYKTSLYSKGKDTMIQDFKFNITIYELFNSPITEHQIPLHQTTLYCPPFLYWIKQFFLVTLEAIGGELQMFFEPQKQRNNMWKFDLLWLLKCSLTSLPKHQRAGHS
jgi:hypothetical protein